MGFELTLTIDVEQNPNAIGEALRSLFFDEQIVPTSARMREVGVKPYRQTGCYDTFDWQSDVEPLEDIHQEERICEACRKLEMGPSPGYLPPPDYECSCVSEEHWTRGRKRVCPSRKEPIWIECRWYWDGDGTLAFVFPDGSVLYNDDCKKDYGWKLVESIEAIDEF